MISVDDTVIAQSQGEPTAGRVKLRRRVAKLGQPQTVFDPRFVPLPVRQHRGGGEDPHPLPSRRPRPVKVRMRRPAAGEAPGLRAT
eukprot:CAMPEP_0175442130 /NCGR_PEP_ID=MMETSP0095-20121207/57985_1 /TAXON_ID=311494 /ORGANISM="Alexandrium monilatum, Strain CCMP3105" /LENGTH=85 /DNA_ID=CAMNT_0016742141 /DNA_START=271 /DNA_END=524 /DNA_ORIENTATION=-